MDALQKKKCADKRYTFSFATHPRSSGQSGIVLITSSKIKNPNLFQDRDFVGPLGLEPRLFCTKNRRVASYTMGHYHNEDANLEQSLG